MICCKNIVDVTLSISKLKKYRYSYIYIYIYIYILIKISSEKRMGLRDRRRKAFGFEGVFEGFEKKTLRV